MHSQCYLSFAHPCCHSEEAQYISLTHAIRQFHVMKPCRVITWKSMKFCQMSDRVAGTGETSQGLVLSSCCVNLEHTYTCGRNLEGKQSNSETCSCSSLIPLSYSLQRMGQGTSFKKESQAYQRPSAMLFMEIHLLWNLVIPRGKTLIDKYSVLFY